MNERFSSVLCRHFLVVNSGLALIQICSNFFQQLQTTPFLLLTKSQMLCQGNTTEEFLNS